MVGAARVQVAAVGADGVARLVRVRQVGEEVVDETGERVTLQRIESGPLSPRVRSCQSGCDLREASWRNNGPFEMTILIF